MARQITVTLLFSTLLFLTSSFAHEHIDLQIQISNHELPSVGSVDFHGAAIKGTIPAEIKCPDLKQPFTAKEQAAAINYALLFAEKMPHECTKEPKKEVFPHAYKNGKMVDDHRFLNAAGAFADDLCEFPILPKGQIYRGPGTQGRYRVILKQDGTDWEYYGIIYHPTDHPTQFGGCWAQHGWGK